MYLNKVFLYGNLTRDPEIKALPSGAQVANFGLATNRVYKDKEGQKKEATEFHNIVAFGRQAEVIGQYLKKGRPVFIEGRIQTRSWETDGKKNYRTEIVVDSFQFGADGGRGSSGANSSAPSQNKGKQNDSEVESGGEEIKYPAEDISPEDIPF